jgi:hypothetical protein
VAHVDRNVGEGADAQMLQRRGPVEQRRIARTLHQRAAEDARRPVGIALLAHAAAGGADHEFGIAATIRAESEHVQNMT